MSVRILLTVLLMGTAAVAGENKYEGDMQQDATGTASGTQAPPISAPTVACASKSGERQHCPADTSAGVTLVRSTGEVACLLGRTWGYDEQGVWVTDGCSGEFVVAGVAPKISPVPVSIEAQAPAAAAPEEPKKFGSYTPNLGFKVADTKYGDLNIKLFTYVRLLNQQGLDPSYTNSFGQTSAVKQRHDLQVNKMIVYFLGWFLSPKFRYMAYVWTANVSQGEGAQVVLAGYLNYTFNKHLTLGGGINSLPGVRSLEGNFPFWLPVDNRPIADEFFRPSYTTGIWAKGNVVKGLDYWVMVGNNLSQLGISAAELDTSLNTWSGSLTWMPTTGEFGKGFGDLESHENLATRFGFHFTRSDENKQSQPTSSSFDNTQIRLSDGSVIFTPNLFGPGITVTDALYHMISADTGIKYHGFSLDAEYYWRWVNDFRGPGTAGLAQLNDNGFQLQTSVMLRPKLIQLYAAGSTVFGGYGDPWDGRLGVNVYPWKRDNVRLNFQYIQLYRSPVGGLSYPYPVGGTGPAFDINFMVSF